MSRPAFRGGKNTGEVRNFPGPAAGVRTLLVGGYVSSAALGPVPQNGPTPFGHGKGRAPMALPTPLHADAEEVRATLAPLRNRFSVALFASGNAFAAGAVIRVAHSFLAREVLLIGQAPLYEKASMGMEKYETVRRFDGEEDFLAHVGERPIWALEKERAQVALPAVTTFPPDVVLLFGSERDGLPESLLARAHRVIGIPLYGVNHSLPLAVAAGIVLHEWARRHYVEGATI